MPAKKKESTTGRGRKMSNKKTDADGAEDRGGYFDPERRNRIATIAAFVILGVVSIATYNGYSVFGGGASASDLYDFVSRLRFLLQQFTLLASWLVFCVYNICQQRIRTGTSISNLLAANQADPEEVQVAQRIFANSLEQTLITVLTQSALLVYLEPDSLSKFIPLINYFFIIGRITFYLGYPQNRGFGTVLTVVPTFVASLYNLTRFFGPVFASVWPF